MASTLIAASLTIGLAGPAYHPEPCVSWASICVPEYVVKYLPTQYRSVRPEPSYRPLIASEDQTRTIAEHFWPLWAVERMVRIADCESSHLPTAVNRSSGASGLWQIMPFWQRSWPGNYFDPWTNGAVAYQIWLVQGFDAWVCKG